MFFDVLVAVRVLGSKVPITKMETRLSVAPDDKAVPLSMNVNEEFKRMAGLWKLNNTFRQDECYLQMKGFIIVKRTLTTTLISLHCTGNVRA